MSPLLKRSLHWAGSALAIAGTVFVGMRLYKYGGDIEFARFGAGDWSVVAALAIGYGTANLLLALAWWNLLRQFACPTSQRWAIRCYGISQLAKYVPGNIFHLAGRQALAMAAGVPAWPLVKSTMWELGLLSSTGLLFGLLAVPWIIPQCPQIAAVAAFAIAAVITHASLRRYVGPAAANAFLAHVAFLALSAIAFLGVTTLVDTSAHGLPWVAMGGAYVIAWLAGLLTPGAPAGVGVRELVLLYLLNGAMSGSEIVTAVVLGRIVTVLGDLGYFAAASLLPAKP